MKCEVPNCKREVKKTYCQKHFSIILNDFMDMAQEIGYEEAIDDVKTKLKNNKKDHGAYFIDINDFIQIKKDRKEKKK